MAIIDTALTGLHGMVEWCTPALSANISQITFLISLPQWSWCLFNSTKFKKKTTVFIFAATEDIKQWQNSPAPCFTIKTIQRISMKLCMRGFNTMRYLQESVFAIRTGLSRRSGAESNDTFQRVLLP